MSLIADITLFLSALGAAFYCRMLSVRLKRLGQTDQGLGGAISALSFQVDEMKSVLESVSASADQRALTLGKLNARADATCRRLELLMATMHECEDGDQPAPQAAFTQPNNIGAAAPAKLQNSRQASTPTRINLRAKRPDLFKEVTK